MPVKKKKPWGQWVKRNITYQFILLIRSSCGHGQVENKKEIKIRLYWAKK